MGWRDSQISAKQTSIWQLLRPQNSFKENERQHFARRKFMFEIVQAYHRIGYLFSPSISTLAEAITSGADMFCCGAGNHSMQGASYIKTPKAAKGADRR